MRIELVRHGMTVGNSKRQYIGSTDEPLCPEGMAALQKIAPDSGVAVVYASPMLRVMQTARILFPAAEVVPVADLREMDFGVFERRSERDMEHDAEYAAWVAGNSLGVCPGGESRPQYAARSSAAFAELVERAAAAGERRLVIVAHGGTVMSVCTAFAFPRKDYFNWNAVTPNGGRWVFEADADRWLSGVREMTIVEQPPKPFIFGNNT